MLVSSTPSLYKYLPFLFFDIFIRIVGLQYNLYDIKQLFSSPNPTWDLNPELLNYKI